MTWVKICGITNLEDALTAIEAGANALGFVFHKKSPRYVDPRTARRIASQLPKRVEKIGVFVDKSLRHMENRAGRIGLTGIQLHVRLDKGRKPEQSQSRLRLRKYLSLPASYFFDSKGRFQGFAWSKGAEGAISAIFLDSGTAAKPGGTGKSFNWERAAATTRILSQNFNVVVAGGLQPGNVGKALHILKPWGVDVSSGVEARPGKKDPAKVRAFVEAVRRARTN